MEIGLTSGCFDLLHYSHLVYLQRCKALCDKLVVGVDSDDLVRKFKGELRPIVPQNERLELIKHQNMVHSAFILHNIEDLDELVRMHRVTQVYKHQSFANMKNVYGLNDTGAKLVIVPDIPNLVSTTEIIGRVVDRYGNTKYQSRINRLEEALDRNLDRNSLPSYDYTCHCCKELYIPRGGDSVRCSKCLQTCFMPKGETVWKTGPMCPTNRVEKS